MKDSHYATNFTPFVLAARSKKASLFLAWSFLASPQSHLSPPTIRERKEEFLLQTNIGARTKDGGRTEEVGRTDRTHEVGTTQELGRTNLIAIH